MLNIQTLIVGEMEANCYLVSSSNREDSSSLPADATHQALQAGQVKPETKCLIIDPGDDADYITQTILENKLSPVAIVLTHGHFDHVLGSLELKLNFPARNASSIADAGGGIPIMLHKNDSKLYSSANQSALHWLKKKALKVPPIDQYIKEGDEIKLGSEKLKVIDTPGHTPGSICLIYHPQTTSYSQANSSLAMRDNITISNGIIFTGDTLFANGVGRTDFSYSSPDDLQTSLTKLKAVSCQLPAVIYPGHGGSFNLSSIVWSEIS